MATFAGNDVIRLKQIGERVRVFDSFYRVLGSWQRGSGLGLSIVQAIAWRIGAEIRLDYTDIIECTGLRVTVSVPNCRPSDLSRG